MLGLFIPALPWLVAALLVGGGGLLLHKNQHRQITRNVTRTITLAAVVILIGLGLIDAFLTQAASFTEIGR